MPNTLLPKRSAVANKVPTTSDLASGELGVNMADRKVYINNGGSIVQVGAGLLSALADVNLTGLASGNTISWNGTAWVASAAGAGTVTSVVAGTGLTGGTINTTGTIALAASGVTAGTYTKITVDQYGRATAGTSLGSSDVTTALGFTPANKAGDTFTGNVLISSGALGVNTTFLNNYLFRIGGNITGATTRGAGEINATAQSDVTSEARGLVSTVSTAAASFTIGQTAAYFAGQGSIGAGSAITTQVGFLASSNLTGGTNNYGFRGAIPSGANRFNLYMDGTADNYLAGNTGIGGLPSVNARLRVLGSGASSEVARLEGGTLSALLLINQTDAPGVNTNRSGISFRKNNTEGGAISVEYNGTRGIVYYDASGATGQHAFYVNGTDVARFNQFGGVSFNGAGYGTAGQFLKSGGASAAAAWGSLTSSEVTTALGFTPYNSTNPSGYITSSALSSYLALTGGTLTGQLNSSGGDSARLFQSNNTSAVGSPAQFFIEHNLGNVNIGNARGNINFSSGALQQGGNQVLHAGNFTTYSPSLTGSGASGTWGISVTGSAGSVAWTNVSGRPTALSSFTNDSGYITNTGNARVGVENNGTLVGTRRNINFIPGTGISLSISDDSANEEVDVTITNGGVTSFNTRTGAVTLSSSDVTSALGYTPLSTGGGTVSGNLTVSSTMTANRITGAGYSMISSATISLSGLDVNTWYPVTISLPAARPTRMRIQNGLNSNVPSWSTHPAGFSVLFEWTSNGSSWGTIPVTRHIFRWVEAYSNVTIVGGISQMGFSSEEVIWLRGGGNYFFEADQDVTPVVRSTTYTGNGGQTASPSTSIVNSPWNQTTSTIAAGNFLLGGNQVLHAGNFTSYSPSLTGSGASGTWGISITGNAGNTSSISNAVGGSYTWTGAQYFQSNLGATSGSLSSPPLQAYATGGNSAFMSFHRAGNYAVNMGLDSDNVLRIGGWSASANRLQMDMSGNLTMAGNVTAYSDERLKKDWATPSQGYIERLAKIRSGTYTRIDSGERQAGASAQDWQALLPEVVSEDNDGYLALAYGNAAVVSVIELAKDNLNLRARIERLESLINKLIGE